MPDLDLPKATTAFYPGDRVVITRIHKDDGLSQREFVLETGRFTHGPLILVVSGIQLILGYDDGSHEFCTELPKRTPRHQFLTESDYLYGWLFFRRAYVSNIIKPWQEK